MPASVHQISSDFDTISNTNLSPAQTQVIAALAQGRTVTAAALGAGIHRTTIHNWLRHEPDFRTAMQQARAEYTATLNDGMHDLAAIALETLRNLLNDLQTPPAIRLKAALAILERPHSTNQAWHLPEHIDDAMEANAPQKQTENVAPVARNAPCPCRSGNKYKRCCGSASPGIVNSLTRHAAA